MSTRAPRITASFLVRFENHVSGPCRCRNCALNTRFPEKCSLLPDLRALNLWPYTLWLRCRTARLCEYRGGYGSRQTSEASLKRTNAKRWSWMHPAMRKRYSVKAHMVGVTIVCYTVVCGVALYITEAAILQSIPSQPFSSFSTRIGYLCKPSIWRR